MQAERIEACFGDRDGFSMKLPDSIKDCVEVFVDGEMYSMLHSVGGRPLIRDKLARTAALLAECEEALEMIAVVPLGESEGCFKAVNEGHRSLAEALLSKIRSEKEKA